MFLNDKELKTTDIKAFYIIRKNSHDTTISIKALDGVSILFCISDISFDPRNMEHNKKVDIKPFIFWDITLYTKETFYLFDITKDEVYLTRLEDNLFQINVNINNPDMIHSPLGDNATFNSLIIDETFSFIYEDKK